LQDEYLRLKGCAVPHCFVSLPIKGGLQTKKV